VLPDRVCFPCLLDSTSGFLFHPLSLSPTIKVRVMVGVMVRVRVRVRVWVRVRVRVKSLLRFAELYRHVSFSCAAERLITAAPSPSI